MKDWILVGQCSSTTYVPHGILWHGDSHGIALRKITSAHERMTQMYSHGIVSRKITSAHERMVIMRRWSSSRYASQRITCLKLADDLVVAHMKMAYNAKLSSWLTRKLIEVFTNLCDQYCMDILSQAWHQHQAQVECSSQRYCVVDCWPSKRIHAQEWISGSYSIALLLFLSYRDPALLRGDQRGLVMDLLKSTIPNSIPLLSFIPKRG